MKIFIAVVGLLTLWSTVLNSGSINKIWIFPPNTKQAATLNQISITAVEEINPRRSMIDPAQLSCLSKNIYFEAAVESTAGKLAVAQVTMNRVRSSRYPDSICEVVYEGRHHASGHPKRDQCQFSWYCDGRGDEPKETPAWRDSQAIAEYVIRTPSLIDITDGSTHYHADYIDAPRWALKKKRLVKIDTHIFYKKTKLPKSKIYRGKKI